MSEPEGARAVRAEDAFDVAAVAHWLKREAGAHRGNRRGPVMQGLDGLPEVRQFAGGASNLTYLLRYPQRDVILRRPPAGSKARSAHDMRREFTIQRQLKPVFGYVPEMIAFCDDPAVIGSDFYLMERLEGTVLRRDLPAGMTLTPERARRLCTDLLDRLLELHAVDAQEVGLGGLGRGDGYVARQVRGWTSRYVAAKTEDVGGFEPVMAWLDARQPADSGNCVIHNDFRLDNIVLSAPWPQGQGQGQAGRQAQPAVVGILDWEMATLGDPLMDLGGALAYWVQADDDEVVQSLRRQPTHLPGMLTRAEVVEYYAARTGLSTPDADWIFYEIFGLFRLAVIAQQIYYRYFHGQTTNEAFSQLHHAVRYLERRCRGLIAAAG
ncbi:phosphotransferase family protein [Paeniglutamicibacter antarcticus]|uniref:Phosphotransferase family protein n=1 Tax=Arthrobacter terrae TaxID=2935737 RepID=A0A931CPQ4_9MICC|nr:phosphotransferase family protein [Arthrobacter terrae]MBG0739851.1 phosphotransferase family protein [Arthrobacter terrae]